MQFIQTENMIIALEGKELFVISEPGKNMSAYQTTLHPSEVSAVTRPDVELALNDNVLMVTLKREDQGAPFVMRIKMVYHLTLHELMYVCAKCYAHLHSEMTPTYQETTINVIKRNDTYFIRDDNKVYAARTRDRIVELQPSERYALWHIIEHMTDFAWTLNYINFQTKEIPDCNFLYDPVNHQTEKKIKNIVDNYDAK